jgi:hypothetical protein
MESPGVSRAFQFSVIFAHKDAHAAITTEVYRTDGITPFDSNQPIMVGTKLSIVGSSNNSDPCNCELLIPEDYFDEYLNPLYGVLSGRDLNDTTGNYDGSLFPAAGDMSVVWDDIVPGLGIGLAFWYGEEAVDGKWFIIDYTALNVGDCNVVVYRYDTSSEPVIFTNTYTFHHVPTRDFDLDTVVNFADYAVLADWWQQNCESPGGCGGADLDDSNDVDIEDLMLFCDYWLEATE